MEYEIIFVLDFYQLKLVEAELECRKFGYELVTIESSDESHEVEQFLRPRGKKFMQFFPFSRLIN